MAGRVIPAGRAWLLLWGYKACKACGEVKGLEDFCECRNLWDGLKSSCRSCSNLRNSEYYRANKDSVAAYQASRSEQRRVQGMEWREKNADHLSAYREANRDRYRRQQRERYQLNKEAIAEYNRRYRQENPDIRRRSNHARRSRKKAQFVEHIDGSILFERDGGICALCLAPVDPQRWWIEHLVPISRGGEHSYANAAVSHPECNNRKKSKLLSEIDWPLTPPPGMEVRSGQHR